MVRGKFSTKRRSFVKKKNVQKLWSFQNFFTKQRTGSFFSAVKQVVLTVRRVKVPNASNNYVELTRIPRSAELHFLATSLINTSCAWKVITAFPPAPPVEFHLAERSCEIRGIPLDNNVETWRLADNGSLIRNDGLSCYFNGFNCTHPTHDPLFRRYCHDSSATFSLFIVYPLELILWLSSFLFTREIVLSHGISGSIKESGLSEWIEVTIIELFVW